MPGIRPTRPPGEGIATNKYHTPRDHNTIVLQPLVSYSFRPLEKSLASCKGEMAGQLARSHEACKCLVITLTLLLSSFRLMQCNHVIKFLVNEESSNTLNHFNLLLFEIFIYLLIFLQESQNKCNGLLYLIIKH